MKKRVLITGAAGSIGSELCRQLHKEAVVFALDFNEMGLHALLRRLEIFGRVGDIRDKETIQQIVSEFKPHIIYHAAAYKSVDMMEGQPKEAIATNVLGTLNILDCAKSLRVKKLIFVSTDKVVNANSIMGKTKSLAETMVVNAGYTVVRFGNVLGSRGSLLEIWQEQLQEGTSITVTDPGMKRYFMTIQEAVTLLIKAAEEGRGGEIICFEMGSPVSIMELAERLIKELGRGEIEIIGNRCGEVLEERIMSQEEEKKALKKGAFYFIRNT